MVPRKRTDTTVLAGESHRVMVLGGAGLLLKPTITSAPDHQKVHLPPVGRGGWKSVIHSQMESSMLSNGACPVAQLGSKAELKSTDRIFV